MLPSPSAALQTLQSDMWVSQRLQLTERRQSKRYLVRFAARLEQKSLYTVRPHTASGNALGRQ
jgi:hypothetical protein